MTPETGMLDWPDKSPGGFPHMPVQPRFRRLAALTSLLLAGTAFSLPPAAIPARAEELNLPPIPMPTTKEECLKMIDNLIMEMSTYMSQEEFGQVYQNIPFDLTMKRDCEAGNYGGAHQQAVGMRPTTAYVPQQGTSQPGNCFLTTACCELVGLPDDCFELSVLRRDRDTVLPALPGGRAEAALYYALAPAILSGLHGRGRGRRLLPLYFTHILPCVAMAWLGFGDLTRRRYRDMLVRLCMAAGLRPAAV
jgi:hypothetical protein